MVSNVNGNGMLVYAHSTGSGTVTNVTIINNTLYNNHSYGVRIDFPSTRASGIVTRNTIGYLNAYGDYSSSSGGSATQDHNLWGINPLFVNVAAGNLQLLVGSPAINAGSPTGAPSTDFAGVSRPQGTGFDIGAFEFVSSAPLSELSPAPRGGH